MNVRLQQFLAAENISQAQFADSINVARASVSHIVAGRNKPGFDFISSMIKRYPTLNVDWLITGNGKMYKTASEPSGSSFPKSDPSLATPSADNALTKEESFIPDDDVVFAEKEKTVSTPLSAPAETDKAEARPDAQLHNSEANIRAISEIITSNKAAETIKNKRKAVKVMIFFDDGTFQEF